MNRHPSFSWATCQCTLVCVGAALFLWGCRLPGGDVPFVLAGFAVWLLVGLWIILQLLVRLIQTWRKKSERGSLFAGGKPWLTALLAILGSIALAMADVPFRLAFALSRPSFDRAVASHLHLSKATWIGLFPISYVDERDQVTTFRLNKDEFPWGYRCLHFDPKETIFESDGMTTYRQLGNRWYTSHYSGW